MSEILACAAKLTELNAVANLADEIEGRLSDSKCNADIAKHLEARDVRIEAGQQVTVIEAYMATLKPSTLPEALALMLLLDTNMAHEPTPALESMNTRISQNVVQRLQNLVGAEFALMPTYKCTQDRWSAQVDNIRAAA